jgi:hypothetical protein
MPWREEIKSLYKQNPHKFPWIKTAEELSVKYGQNVTPDALRGVCRRSGQGDSSCDRAKSVVEPPTQREGQLPKTRPETAVWHITDIHEGKKTDSFDPDILEERLIRGARKIILIAKILKKTYTLDKLVIMITGDAIDNDSIFPNQQAHVSEKAKAGREQVNRLMQTMAKVIAILREEFETIDIECVYGNHGRVSKTTDEKNNWDLVFYDQLKAYYNNDKNITVNMSEKFYKIVDVQGHGFLLYHGHAIKMSHGIPWYGMTKRIGAWTSSIGGFKYALVGHFHTLGMTQFAGIDIYMGGTAASGDDWALEGLGTTSDQRYWFFGVHPEVGVTWEYKINLVS